MKRLPHRSVALGYEPAIAIAIVFSMILLLVTTGLALLTPVKLGDIPVYTVYAHHIAAGQVPYRNLPLEYPPGVLPFLMAPLLASSYVVGFVCQTCIAVLLLLADGVRRIGIKKLLVCTLPLLPLVQFYFYQLDIFAALALYASVLYVQRRNYSLAAFLLAISTLIKAYPAFCLLGLIWCVPKEKRWRYVAVFSCTVGAVLVPLFIFAPTGAWHSIMYHTGRPAEFESTVAAIGYLGHLFGLAVRVVPSHESLALAYKGQTVVAAGASVALLVSAIVVGRWGIQNRLRVQPATLSIWTLLLFILFFKVGSPQYLICLVVLLPLALKEFAQKQWQKLVAGLTALSVVIWLQFVVLFHFYTTGYRQPGALVACLSVLRIGLLLLLIFALYRHTSKPLSTIEDANN